MRSRVSCNVPRCVFCMGTAVGRIFFLPAIPCLIDAGAVAHKVPKFIFGMVADVGRMFFTATPATCTIDL